MSVFVAAAVVADRCSGSRRMLCMQKHAEMEAPASAAITALVGVTAVETVAAVAARVVQQ